MQLERTKSPTKSKASEGEEYVLPEAAVHPNKNFYHLAAEETPRNTAITPIQETTFGVLSENGEPSSPRTIYIEPLCAAALADAKAGVLRYDNMNGTLNEEWANKQSLPVKTSDTAALDGKEKKRKEKKLKGDGGKSSRSVDSGSTSSLSSASGDTTGDNKKRKKKKTAKERTTSGTSDEIKTAPKVDSKPIVVSYPAGHSQSPEKVTLVHTAAAGRPAPLGVELLRYDVSPDDVLVGSSVPQSPPHAASQPTSPVTPTSPLSPTDPKDEKKRRKEEEKLKKQREKEEKKRKEQEEKDRKKREKEEQKKLKENKGEKAGDGVGEKTTTNRSRTDSEGSDTAATTGALCSGRKRKSKDKSKRDSVRSEDENRKSKNLEETNAAEKPTGKGAPPPVPVKTVSLHLASETHSVAGGDGILRPFDQHSGLVEEPEQPAGAGQPAVVRHVGELLTGKPGDLHVSIGNGENVMKPFESESGLIEDAVVATNHQSPTKSVRVMG